MAMSYVSFERAIQLAACAGRGVLLSKSDIESTSRFLPVHPSCFYLLIPARQADLRRPCLSCKYFEMFSSFLEWVGNRFEFGYSLWCAVGCVTIFNSCSDSASHCLRRRLMTPRLSFLGIQINTMEMVFRLPSDKLAHILALIDTFIRSKKVTLRNIQSLLGFLNYACKVFPMGRVFNRRLALAICSAKQLHHFTWLTSVLRNESLAKILE